MVAQTAPKPRLRRPVVGRAGFDVTHDKATKSTRENRRRTLAESMRHLDPEWTTTQARRNPNVDPSRTGQNVAAVNLGGRKFKWVESVESVDEVLDYGDARFARVGRKVQDRSFLTTRIVVHLPKTMCVEREWVDAEGETRRYWAPRDRAEALQYFAVARGELAKVLPGGADAIHGWALNFDEYTPHMQLMADTLGDDPKAKQPGGLRVMASQAWGQHGSVRVNGKAVTGATKMRGYQQAFRERMVAEGYPVETEPDPVRSQRKQPKADYVDTQERAEDLDAWEDDLRAREAALSEHQQTWGALLVAVERAKALGSSSPRDARPVAAPRPRWTRAMLGAARERGEVTANEFLRLSNDLDAGKVVERDAGPSL